MMIAEEHKTTISSYIAAYNDFDIDGMVDLIHPAVDLPNGMNAGEELRLSGRSEFEFRDFLFFRLLDADSSPT